MVVLWQHGLEIGIVMLPIGKHTRHVLVGWCLKSKESEYTDTYA